MSDGVGRRAELRRRFRFSCQGINSVCSLEYHSHITSSHCKHFGSRWLSSVDYTQIIVQLFRPSLSLRLPSISPSHSHSLSRSLAHTGSLPLSLQRTHTQWLRDSVSVAGMLFWFFILNVQTLVSETDTFLYHRRTALLIFQFFWFIGKACVKKSYTMLGLDVCEFGGQFLELLWLTVCYRGERCVYFVLSVNYSKMIQSWESGIVALFCMYQL